MCQVKAYARSFGMKTIITRGNNVYGPHQYPEKIIPKFINQLLRDLKWYVQGMGRCYCQMFQLRLDDLCCQCYETDVSVGNPAPAPPLPCLNIVVVDERDCFVWAARFTAMAPTRAIICLWKMSPEHLIVSCTRALQVSLHPRVCAHQVYGVIVGVSTCVGAYR